MFVNQEKDKIYKFIEPDPVTAMLTEQDAIIERLKSPTIKLHESYEKLSRIYARDLVNVLETHGVALQQMSAVIKAAADNVLTSSDALVTFQKAIERVMERHDIPSITLSDEQMAKVVSSIELAQPYMTPEQSATVVGILPKGKGPITRDIVKKLFSILLQLLPILIAFLPDKQLDQIIEQNGQIITQNEQMIEQNDSLITAINSLNEAIVILWDEIDEATGEPSREPSSGEPSMEAGDCDVG